MQMCCLIRISGPPVGYLKGKLTIVPTLEISAQGKSWAFITGRKQEMSGQLGGKWRDFLSLWLPVPY